MRFPDPIVVQDCGLCYFDPATQEFVDDKNCDYHREQTCTTCGESASKSTITHGVFGRGTTHTPSFL